MAGGKRGGVMGIVTSLALAAIVGGGLLGIARMNNIHSIKDIYTLSKEKSDKVNECYSSGRENCQIIAPEPGGSTAPVNNQLSDDELGYSGPKKGIAYLQNEAKLKKDYLLGELKKLQVGKENKNSFKMEEWPHWALISDSSTCWTSRKEAMANQAISGSLKFIDKNHKETKDKAKACAITAGKWTDPYTGKPIDKLEDVGIDHIVPLQVANSLGGNEWSTEKRLQYANDTQSVLIVTSKDSLKKRKNQDLAKFVPENKKYQCEFAKSYTGVSVKYGITITEESKEVLTKLLSNCNL